MTADTLARLTTIHTTPGFTDEKIHLFLAHELKKGTHRREADEFMEVQTAQVVGGDEHDSHRRDHGFQDHGGVDVCPLLPAMRRRFRLPG